MRIESSVISLSWIPLGAMEGAGTELAFRLGIAHYDPPPPEVLEDLEALKVADRFRFANDLRAWIEVDDGRIVDYGHAGGGLIGATTSAGESSSPHGVRCISVSRNQRSKSIRPVLATSLPSWS